jgi:gingipain R
MKKNILLLLMFLANLHVLQAQTRMYVISNSPSETVVEIFFSNSNLQNNSTHDFINIPSCTPWQKLGCPNLPKFSFSLQIPASTNSVIEIMEQQSLSFSNIYIAPSKGVVSREILPESITATEGQMYKNNSFFPLQIVQSNTPYILRNLRGQTFQVAPVQYNPITKQCIAYQYLKIKIKHTGISSQNALPTASLPEIINETFEQLYHNQFANYNLAKKEIRYTPVLENDKLLVLCPSKYLSSIQDFITWKKMKGIYTKLVNVDTINGGISETSIYNTIKSYYTNWQMSHVLIVGNETDIPPYTGATIYGNGSDNPYGYQAGSDHYCDIIMGRFVAEDTTQVQAQVLKSIAYEKTPQLSKKWFEHAMGIGSNQGGTATLGDDGEADWEHQRDILDSSVISSNYPKGPFKVGLEFYDGDHGNKDALGNPSYVEVIDSINNFGVSIINYSGHGGVDGIFTTNFLSQQIPLLHNTNGDWPFMLVVGCSPGNYVTPYPCFAENLNSARDAVNNKPMGTIINAMSTVAQWWNEPMEAQDEFNAVLRGDRKYPIKHSFAGMLVNGFNSMMDKYNIPGTSDSISGDQMTDTWQIFGDPTLVVRTADSGNIYCGFSGNIPMHATTYSVNCNRENADLCLYHNGEILATAKCIAGVANFVFPQGVHDSLGTVLLTATKYDYTPQFVNLIIANYPTTIDNSTLQSYASVYPNPSSNVLFVETAIEFQQLELLNAIGEVVYRNNAKETKTQQVNVSSLPSGVYVLKIQTKQGIITKKFQKL